MKPFLLWVVLGLTVPCVAYAVDGSPGNDDKSAPGAGHGGPPHEGPPQWHGVKLTDEEKQELHQAHQDALDANPDLAKEDQDLREQMMAHQKKVEAAMIKADPKVAPILATIDAAQEHHSGMGGPGGSPPPDNKSKPPGGSTSGT